MKTLAIRSARPIRRRNGAADFLFADLPWLVHGFTTRRGGVSSFVKFQSPAARSLI